VHDYSPGIPPSGLFWTIEIPRGAFSVDRRARHASLRLRDFPLVQQFTFLGPHDAPAVLDIAVEWDALDAPIAVRSGAAVPPTDPAAFLGTFASARATGRFSGRQAGFRFTSTPGASTDTTYAEIGTERNGVFLR
jgi:hypothetical protein